MLKALDLLFVNPYITVARAEEHLKASNPTARQAVAVLERHGILEEVTGVGYEIPFTRHFYRYVPPRSLEAIDADLQRVSAEIMDLLNEITRPSEVRA